MRKKVKKTRKPVRRIPEEDLDKTFLQSLKEFRNTLDM